MKYLMIIFLIIFGLLSCSSEFIDSPHIQPIDESKFINSIEFREVNIDGSEFIYENSNEVVVFWPYGADFLTVEQNGTSYKVEGFVGEGPGKVPAIWLYGLASDTSIYAYAQSKFVEYSFKGEHIRSGKLDTELSAPGRAILNNTHLGPSGEIISASVNAGLVGGPQSDFIRHSFTISCLDLSTQKWQNTGYLNGRGVYANEMYGYSYPILDVLQDTIFSVYPDDPGMVYKFTCDNVILEPVKISIRGWEAPFTGANNNDVGHRIEAFQRNSSFLQFFASKEFFYTVHIMPAESKNVSNSIEEIQERSSYRKRYLSVFSKSGGDALVVLDLRDRWSIADVLPNGNILLTDDDQLDGTNPLIMLEYDWR